MEIVLVQPGETLTEIAIRNSIRPEQLAADNGLTVFSPLAVGQALVVLQPAQEVLIEEGDSLYGLSERYGVSVNQLLRNNPQLGGRTLIRPGERLVLSYADEKQGRMSVTGYAYAYIEEGVLRKTLPYLTYLSIFGYGVTADGGLVQHEDGLSRRLAQEYGVGAVMLLCSLDEYGTFGSGNFIQVLENPEAQERLLNEVVVNMRLKGYVGLDLDFEYIPAENAEQYIAFAARAAERMQAEGWFLLTALAPKYRADQPGLLYEGHNYPALGAVSDFVLVMTYEWGYGGGPAMAIAPIDQVERVLSYAVSEIPPGKINMGVPMYGYDWTLPYVKGESRTTSIGCRAAEALAIRADVPISFDETAQSPFFRYSEGGKEHEVWFEDARSFRSKYALADSYGLNGIGVWSIMRFYQPAWSVLNALYDIERT